MTVPQELLDSIDAATAGTPDIDRGIADACLARRIIERIEGGKVVHREVWVTRDGVEHRTPPPFTTRLDAVLLLYDKADVPEMVPSDPLVACRQALHYGQSRALRDPVPVGPEAARPKSSSLSTLLRDLAAPRQQITRREEGLLDRLDTATVGGPDFDWTIAENYLEKRRTTVDKHGTRIYPIVWVTKDGAEHEAPPPFTTSVDAALLLCATVPEMVPSDPLVICRQAVRARKALPIMP